MPHPLQWCRLKVNVKRVLHTWHMVTLLSGTMMGAWAPNTPESIFICWRENKRGVSEMCVCVILAPYTEFSAKRSSLLPLLADSFSQSLGEIGHVGVVQIFTFSMNIDFLSLNGFWLNASLTIIHFFFSGSELYIHSTQEGRGDHVSVM